MGEACTMNGSNRGFKIFVGNPQKEKEHQEDLGVCGRIAFKWVLKRRDVDVDQTEVAEARNQRRAPVKRH